MVSSQYHKETGTLHIAHALEHLLVGQEPEPTRNIFTQDYMTLLGFGNMNPEQLLKERILPSLPKHKNRIPLEVQSLFTKTSAAGN